MVSIRDFFKKHLNVPTPKFFEQYCKIQLICIIINMNINLYII